MLPVRGSLVALLFLTLAVPLPARERLTLTNHQPHDELLLEPQVDLLGQVPGFAFHLAEPAEDPKVTPVPEAALPGGGPVPGLLANDAVRRHLTRCQGPEVHDRVGHYLVYANGLVRRTEYERWRRFADSPYRQAVLKPFWPQERKGEVLLQHQDGENRMRAQWRYDPSDRAVRREGEREDHLPWEAFYGQRQERDRGLYDGRVEAYTWRWLSSRWGLVPTGNVAGPWLAKNKGDGLWQKGYPEPSAFRWQARWLWRLEGRAKDNQSVLRLYLDPATGVALGSALYTAEGGLQRLGFAPLVNSGGGCGWEQGEAWLLDVARGNYSVEGVALGEVDYQPKLARGFFTPNQLRKIGKR